MNIEMGLEEFEQDIPALGPFEASDITRGICRYLRNLGYSPLTEFKLLTKRRVDVIGVNKAGQFIIVEIKSSVADFRADDKWPEYMPFGDQLYFAVANGFPLEILPEECGIMIADPYNAAVIREAPVHKLNAARRRTQTTRFAKTAADRLHLINDPNRK
jgi:hypothetical protein|tara:strand:- start:11688 stop:12164 length:477 start_codon:yes stop_codon:yes gene_type:complete